MARTLSKIITGIVSPVAASTPGAPSWVTALTVNKWTVVPGSYGTIAAQDPGLVSNLNPNHPLSPPWKGQSGQGSVVTGWNSGAFAPDVGSKGTYLVAGGGHHDYFGNEVYAFDMATPGWSRLNAPTVDVDVANLGSQNTLSNGFYAATVDQPNGGPGIPHTYWQLGYDLGRKCLVLLRCQTAESPVVIAKAALMPLTGSPFTAGQWQRGSQQSSGNNAVNSDGWMCYDSTRRVFHTQGGTTGSGFATYNPATGVDQDAIGTWTSYPSKGPVGSRKFAAYDPVLDIVVICNPSDQKMWGYAAGSLASSATQLTVGAGAPTFVDRAGWQYSPALGGFVYWADGQPVYKAVKGAGAWNTATWTFTQLTDGGSLFAPSKAVNGTFGRFQIASYSNAEVAILINSVDMGVLAYRLA